MNTPELFERIRVVAATRRDEQIQQAKEEYAERIRQIDALAKDLHGDNQLLAKTKRGSSVPVGELVEQVLPGDDPFSISDVMGLLTTAELPYVPSELAVRRCGKAMVSNGKLRTIKNEHDGRTRLYAFPHVGGPTTGRCDFCRAQGFQRGYASRRNRRCVARSRSDRKHRFC